MQATIGDRLHVHGNSVGQPDKMGEIVEVKGTGGGAALSGALRRRAYRPGVPRAGRCGGARAPEGGRRPGQEGRPLGGPDVACRPHVA
jgi:hypothetical protein